MLSDIRGLWLLAFVTLSIVACDNSSTPGVTSPPPTTGLVQIKSGLYQIYSTLASDGPDRIYTGKEARKTDGTIIWSAAIPGCEAKYKCFPTVDSAGNVYVPTGGGLKALTPDGTLRWTNAEATFRLVATGNSGRLYAYAYGFPQYWVYALDASTGTTIWKTPLATLSNTLVVDESRSTLYLENYGGPIALNVNTGAVRWSAPHPCGGTGGYGALASDGTLYITCTSNVKEFRMYAFDPTGAEKWHTLLDTTFVSTANSFTPLIDDAGNIYGSSQSAVVSVSPSGTVNWRFAGLTDNYVHPAIDIDRNVYVIAKHGVGAPWTLLVIKDGAVVSNEGEIDALYAGALLLAPNGRIYYNANGTLTSLETAGAPPAAQWSQFGRDAGRSSHR